MSLLLNIVLFVVFLSILMALHEAGHFIVARLNKIEIQEFGIGLPPRITRLFTYKGTEFTLNWLPFGAFVLPKGENDPTVAGGLAAAKPLSRLSVLLGGPIMNLLTGFLLISIVIAMVGAPDATKVEVIDITANSPAALAGLQAGDIIVDINGIRIDSTSRLSAIVNDNLGQEIDLSYVRGQDTHTITLTPRVTPPEGEGPIGISMSNPVIKTSWVNTLPTAFSVTLEQSKQLLMAPVMLIRGQLSPDEGRLVSVKGIFDIFNQVRIREQETAATSSPQTPANSNTIWFLATLSIALGITNLLPIPALDGGRILFVLPELLFRKRVPVRFENLVNMIGFVALILLMVVMTINDIANPIVLP